VLDPDVRPKLSLALYQFCGRWGKKEKKEKKGRRRREGTNDREKRPQHLSFLEKGKTRDLSYKEIVLR